ncbi:MAG: type II toxin-antitoxin system RelE/ParE family toxin [Acidobacteria bacterium]|nr:type II toxin-antitoxin system RelE/ParE family toxin [Acidobacteriota bacterium]MBI3471285.1 type II toxin-antitoxin system RelE/ParE family toxin [Candidatus Solibacter usitatus]
MMGHRRTPQADSDLDEIWYYLAYKSGSVEIADRLIDSITNRFFLLARHPNIGRAPRRGFASRSELSRGRVRHHLPHRG